MANHKSTAKRAKQDVKRRARNRAGKSHLKTALKKYRALVAEGSAEAKGLSEICSLIDRTAKHGFIHGHAASRLKSKLTKQTLKTSA